MNIWAIADLHLAKDSRIEKPMDGFGGCWVDHDKKLKEIWLRMVEEDDLVIIAGDISWAMRLDEALADLQWIDALPGTKLIVKGNHDLWWSGISKVKTACKDLPSLHFLQHDAFAFGDAVIFGTRGWVCPQSHFYSEGEDGATYRREVLRLQASADAARAMVQRRKAETGREPVLIAAMHFPPMNERFDPNDFTRILEESGAQHVVYGHLHGQASFKNGPQGVVSGLNYHLISLDRLECCPKRIYGNLVAERQEL